MKNPRVQVKLSREELSKLALYLRHALPFKYFKPLTETEVLLYLL